MSLIITHVHVKVKPGTADAFIAATETNARNSRQESGNVRFDILQSEEDPNSFVLVEIYRDASDVTAHKETDHYKEWRDTVADMMEEPRRGVKYSNVDPDDSGWA